MTIVIVMSIGDDVRTRRSVKMFLLVQPAHHQTIITIKSVEYNGTGIRTEDDDDMREEKPLLLYFPFCFLPQNRNYFHLKSSSVLSIHIATIQLVRVIKYLDSRQILFDAYFICAKTIYYYDQH